MYQKYCINQLIEEHRKNNVGLQLLTINDMQNSNENQPQSQPQPQPQKIQSMEHHDLIVSAHGEVYRKMKSGYWKKIENKSNHIKGYNVILINKKQYTRSKVVLCAFKKIGLNDKVKCIYHLNKNKLDCSINNLKVAHWA
jgi:hypothetical protein